MFFLSFFPCFSLSLSSFNYKLCQSILILKRVVDIICSSLNYIIFLNILYNVILSIYIFWSAKTKKKKKKYSFFLVLQSKSLAGLAVLTWAPSRIPPIMSNLKNKKTVMPYHGEAALGILLLSFWPKAVYHQSQEALSGTSKELRIMIIS